MLLSQLPASTGITGTGSSGQGPARGSQDTGTVGFQYSYFSFIWHRNERRENAEVAAPLCLALDEESGKKLTPAPGWGNVGMPPSSYGFRWAAAPGLISPKQQLFRRVQQEHLGLKHRAGQEQQKAVTCLNRFP